MIKSLKNGIIDSQAFFEKHSWSMMVQDYCLVIFKANLNAVGAMIITHSIRIDLELNMTGFVLEKKVMEMKSTGLTCDVLLKELQKLEKNVVNFDTPLDATSIVADKAQVGKKPSTHVNCKSIAVYVGPFKCRLCKKTFVSRNILDRHVLKCYKLLNSRNKQMEYYSCFVCKKKFGSRHHLDEHQLYHLKELRQESGETEVGSATPIALKFN